MKRLLLLAICCIVFLCSCDIPFVGSKGAKFEIKLENGKKIYVYEDSTEEELIEQFEKNGYFYGKGAHLEYKITADPNTYTQSLDGSSYLFPIEIFEFGDGIHSIFAYIIEMPDSYNDNIRVKTIPINVIVGEEFVLNSGSLFTHKKKIGIRTAHYYASEPANWLFSAVYQQQTNNNGDEIYEYCKLVTKNGKKYDISID